MVDDAILAREAQLVYSNTIGFEPVGSTLNSWQGTVQGGGREFHFQIYLPEYFPNVPPVVRSLGPITHSNVDEEGFVNLRILDSWRAEFHLYQVINALRGLMARAPPIPADVKLPPATLAPVSRIAPSQPASVEAKPKISSHEYDTLKGELNRLKDDMTNREEEIARLRARQVTGIATTEGSEGVAPGMSLDIRSEIESERLATSEMLANLHERFDSGEVSVFDFSRLLKKYQKELHVLDKKLEYLSTKGR